jgi:hypothetical protein
MGTLSGQVLECTVAISSNSISEVRVIRAVNLCRRPKYPALSQLSHSSGVNLLRGNDKLITYFKLGK